MSNACFKTHNPIGGQCRDTPRGHYLIPSGGPFVAITDTKEFNVVYFKFGANMQYNVRFVKPNTWTCNCPDFIHQHRAETQTCCKHVQACIDKEMGTSRGLNYDIFLKEQVKTK